MKKQPFAITGAGGGGGGKGGSDAPEEEDDNLRSKATANILVAMCEGEIKGYATGTAETSVFLNDVPVQTPQGVDNFAKDAIKIVRRKGKNDQSSLKRFSDVRIEQSVGVKTTKKGGPAVVTTSHKDLDALIVRVGVSALYQVDEETGDVSGSELDFNIKIIDFLGTVRHDEDKKINGKSRGSVDFE